MEVEVLPKIKIHLMFGIQATDIKVWVGVWGLVDILTDLLLLILIFLVACLISVNLIERYFL